MISFDEALSIIIEQRRLCPSDVVPLRAASGRVLAAPCIAKVDSPPADAAAMDGYALRDEDLRKTANFQVIGTAYPGAPFDGPVGYGESVRVFTGSPIPDGLDRVVIQENVTQVGNTATVTAPSGAKRHIRSRGGDFRAGDELLPAGRMLDARAIVAAAGSDMREFTVFARPRVAIIATGDELVDSGDASARPGSIPESGSYGVAALAEFWGASSHHRQRLPDDRDLLKAGLRSALHEADIVVVIGGASVGEKDFSKRVFADLGVEMLFDKVAMIPGKPVWLGRIDGRLVLGLPGNPSSAMVTARLFLAPLVAGMGGRDPACALRWRSVRLDGTLPAVGERETFVRAALGDDGAIPAANQDSSMQRTLANADVLIRRPPHAAAVGSGSMIDVLDF